MDVSLYERPRIAWRNKARLFVSVHCNAAGLGENPLWNNGSSVYWYQPQSQALAGRDPCQLPQNLSRNFPTAGFTMRTLPSAA